MVHLFFPPLGSCFAFEFVDQILTFIYKTIEFLQILENSVIGFLQGLD